MFLTHFYSLSLILSLTPSLLPRCHKVRSFPLSHPSRNDARLHRRSTMTVSKDHGFSMTFYHRKSKLANTVFGLRHYINSLNYGSVPYNYVQILHLILNFKSKSYNLIVSKHMLSPSKLRLSKNRLISSQSEWLPLGEQMAGEMSQQLKKGACHQA